MNSRTALAHGHGVVSFATLRSALAHAEIRRLISAGQLRPVRRGWYAAPWADKTVVAAVASGGVCSCVSALKLAGVWVPNIGRRTHARACGAAHRARPDNDFCRQYGRPARPREFGLFSWALLPALIRTRTVASSLRAGEKNAPCAQSKKN